jgi:hypothetical protein
MTTGLNYTGFVKQIARMAVVEEDDPNFLDILPQAITYAENRIYRDLDFLFTSIANEDYNLIANRRELTVRAGTFVVLEQVNVVTPVSAFTADDGVRNPLLPVTRDFIDATCNSAAGATVPKYFAVVGNEGGNLSIIVGPRPDAAYKVELVGTFRPDSLSASNTTTFVSSNLPDLLTMAAMIYISGYQRNFGATAANDPQMPISYETQYQALLMGAMSEESRKKFEAAAWSSKSSSPASKPTRG